MLASVTHITPLTTFRRARFLPNNGRVLVKPGQSVNAADVLAEAYAPGRHVMVDILRALHVARSDQLDRAVDRKVGELLHKGDVLAQSTGMLRRVVRAPVDGEIVAIAGGKVLIETRADPIGLLAAYSGQVAEVVPERGAIIEASGALVQGVWGNGRIDSGTLLNLARSPDDELQQDRLDVSMRGAVLLAGRVAAAEVLRMAQHVALRGLVLGSLPTGLLAEAEALDFPVVVLEGFRELGLNTAAYRILSTNENREICLNGQPWNRTTGNRPEVFISLPSEGRLSPESLAFQPGQTVRVLAPPYASQIGVLQEVCAGPQAFPTGLRAMAGRVRLENNEVVLVPLANMDVLA